MQLPADNDLYFACIDLAGRDCLVIGDGAMAAEKVEGLLAAGAHVRIVSQDPEECIARYSHREGVRLERRGFRPDDVVSAFLVVSATGDAAVDERVAMAAEEHGKLLNVADVPQLCNFILPAVVRDGPIAVAISTAGASPALAQRIKGDVGALLERPYARLAARLRDLRPWARANLATYEERRDFFASIVGASPDPLDLLEREDVAGLEGAIETVQARALERSGATSQAVPR